MQTLTEILTKLYNSLEKQSAKVRKSTIEVMIEGCKKGNEQKLRHNTQL